MSGNQPQSSDRPGCPLAQLQGQRWPVMSCVLLPGGRLPWYIVSPWHDSHGWSILCQQGHLSCSEQQREKGEPVGSGQLFPLKLLGEDFIGSSGPAMSPGSGEPGHTVADTDLDRTRGHHPPPTHTYSLDRVMSAPGGRDPQTISSKPLISQMRNLRPRGR